MIPLRIGTDMQRVAEAMRVLHILVNCNGRRRQRLELASTMRWTTWDSESPMLTVKMAPRKLRRAIQKKHFRPVHGYVGPAKQARRPIGFVDEPNPEDVIMLPDLPPEDLADAELSPEELAALPDLPV